MFKEHGVALDVEPCDPGSTRTLVMADPIRVGHVLVNLLINALHYTPPDGSVGIALLSNADGVEFAVADSGAGIPAQYLHRVFEKFFRVPGQTGVGGSGLGLAIAQDIIKAHGGRITVESDEGQGSTFRFTLPHAARHPFPAARNCSPLALRERVAGTPAG